MQTYNADIFQKFIKEDHEFQIIECYGGMAAERIVFNTNTSGVSQDLAVASKYAEHMVKYYGMNDAFGPVSIIPAKGCYYSKLLSEQADMIIHDMLVDFYHKTEKLMIKYRDALEALSIALLEKETLYREEIIEILSKYKEKD